MKCKKCGKELTQKNSTKASVGCSWCRDCWNTNVAEKRAKMFNSLPEE